MVDELKHLQWNEREYVLDALRSWHRIVSLALPQDTRESLQRGVSRLQLSRAQALRLETEATILLATVIDHLIQDISSPRTRKTPSQDTPPDEPLPQLDPL